MQLKLTGILVADGSSDQMLRPILQWLLEQHLPPGIAPELDVPDWGRLPVPARTVVDKLKAAREYFPADVYFVHRDSEKYSTWSKRCAEIDNDVQATLPTTVQIVRVIPVQMTESWLLHNEAAIRLAAGNPSGRMELALPRPQDLEEKKEAKEYLLGLLRLASGLKPRQLQKFKERERRRLHRLAELQQDDGFAILRHLPAFKALEAEITTLAAKF
jgi:hypothetical protein